MPDFLLNEALKRLAGEAATHFSSLVASGDQIPFDLAETSDGGGPFYSYVPLTARFVRERESELAKLDSFAAACDAVEEAGVAAPYLETRGEAVPADPRRRAARMLTLFVAELWDGCGEFSLDRDRLEVALASLDAESRDPHEAEVLIAPLVGLRMKGRRLKLPSGVRIVRADAIEAPAEALSSEGMGRAPWEPQFLALAEQSGEPEGTAEALRQLHELISVMRLFKAGGIALGPYAFAPTGEGQWRRVATGSPAPRPGGYELSAEEGRELTELARALEERPNPGGALAWAVRRFELGCGRATALEGLSDHLLALRAVLEGKGPVGASLPLRAAALIASDSLDRGPARERVEAAMELERELMGGGRGLGRLELALWVEEGVRRMLRQAALGELGDDICTAADETLIASGLAAGDAQITVAVQDEVAAGPAADLTPLAGELTVREEAEARVTVTAGREEATADAAAMREQGATQEEEEDEMDKRTRIMEPIPAEDEIRITANNWLEEVAVDNATLEWPAVEGRGQRRERIDTPRVRHLFPVPEDADWEIRELEYDHYRRRAS